MTRRVLVIDDEDDIREITALTLRHLAGWKVTAARSGAHGIRLAADGGFDAILLDVMMPDLDGEATARRLREDERTGTVPIVLLSAVPGLPDWATSLGISALVAKPFDPAGLPGAIREALHW